MLQEWNVREQWIIDSLYCFCKNVEECLNSFERLAALPLSEFQPPHASISSCEESRSESLEILRPSFPFLWLSFRSNKKCSNEPM